MTYRVGDHHGVTIVRDGDGARCDRPDHDCDRGHLVGVMLTAEDAALVVEALNRKAEDFGRWCVNETNEKCSGLEALEARKAEPCIGICAGCTPECHLAGDSCSCSFLPGGTDPGCPVHQDCTCPQPGLPSRTCPRHGAVM